MRKICRRCGRDFDYIEKTCPVCNGVLEEFN